MRGKRVLLGITGGIAAYKIAFLIRILKKSGAEVKCILTPASSDFISPLVLSTLSENPVGIEFWNKEDGTWNNHVEYGLWADIFVVAPLTANSLSKMANGSSDNLLLATYLSMKTKTLVAPAMDLDMYAHPTTKRNLDVLIEDGVGIIPVESGELASGLSGEGRMAEPETIHQVIQNYFDAQLEAEFKGKKVLVTAGPTFESIDPVRFIGNHSSGKMGYRIAEELLSRGAHVILVSGPTKEELEHDNLTLIPIKTAIEMLKAVQLHWSICSYGIFSAAVADYRPKSVADQKIKKNDDELSIELIKNPDILKWAGDTKSSDQLLVGFALETSHLLENGKKKLAKKNLNLIVLNTLEDKGAGFGVDTNKISILDNHNNLAEFELKSKKEVASDIVSHLKMYISK
ncbi:MAG: bifunctional phosphopantothenoylcysteine decarboxylase/phosphopantothenate--cysteine ligase CoaBC [Crocinitomicaceae bacterium]|nr:bifunctional phosphopantothenoylcysteine decarboxylase/phosphopantothenate--cysteine ligase CoaBC [Crocinitomicaceae bacterium]MDC0100537.1 bifunctional phosphopantothenoylcysteine decarboxylase/phosphopantothenate--cysteine ligase CoaBC [Crocinitomicaceae bacterium]MDC1384581.1 bifunctional phosphopantothenoylcysteine decarboxylase/phosphopantothenate--cysteine ligase CoaBC [Crocinitomicaceae bacterium]|tara:strand:+ start:17251 stop:18456 length:1206 start_codon:yes stop_codon:yes gene_type:complete